MSCCALHRFARASIAVSRARPWPPVVCSTIQYTHLTWLLNIGLTAQQRGGAKHPACSFEIFLRIQLLPVSRNTHANRISLKLRSGGYFQIFMGPIGALWAQKTRRTVQHGDSFEYCSGFSCRMPVGTHMQTKSP